MSTGVAGADRGVTVLAADYCSESADIRAVRFAVFVDEQAVPPELEMDERDAECFHVLARERAGVPIGTGRIDIAAGGRVGRMAVLAPWRGSGVGSRIIDALHAHALTHGCEQVWCHAQLTAQRFYERAGYVVDGDTFEEAGITHITMRCRLVP